MNAYRDLGIQKKMLVMNLLICGVVLLVAIAALFTFQVFTFHSNFKRQAMTLSYIIANNCSAAMAAGDQKKATELLNGLKVEPTVISASLVLPNALATNNPNPVFAFYQQLEDKKALRDYPKYRSSEFVRGHLLVMQPIRDARGWVGSLYLRLDYAQTSKNLFALYAQMIAMVMIISTGLGMLLSRRLGRSITGPVLQLARTAQVIGANKDYSMRAAAGRGADELGRLTESFNEMLNRIQSQDAKMEALINSIDGIVWERTPDNGRFTFVSRQSETLLGYPPEQWLGESHLWVDRLDPQDALKAIQTGHELAAKGRPYVYDYRMLAADGRTVWIRESGMVLIENGHAVAVRGILQDITRHKQDAEQLDKLNRQLIDASRQAGMADVATGVLHNVGNVLNSVSVSATLMGERLRQSKVPNLRRATGMLRAQNGQLPEFLTNDPKGKLLPTYLDTVAEQLAGEQNELISEMESVGKHIEHIKEIVAMQQSYAKVSGAYELLSVTDLVEDALRINMTAFTRHGIELVRDFAPDLPAVSVDRHKVLQIVINLLRNSKHALEEMRGREKRIVVRVCMSPPDQVRVIVQDNGIGIPAENMNKIFNHGFTTKKAGHGFGLHSGANAAKEMGASLQARSDGPGKGAEFTLTIPVATSRAVAARSATTERI
jgi:PAS domain S-box-containing protein